MITWNDLVGYIRATYKIAEEGNGFIHMVFAFNDGRSQIVSVLREVLRGGTEEWIQIASPIAEIGRVDVNAVLREVGGMVCGGLAVHGNYLVLRDALPLANMQVSEFERPLALITVTADELEKKFVGHDVL